jgi:hypothetical protein
LTNLNYRKRYPMGSTEQMVKKFKSRRNAGYVIDWHVLCDVEKAFDSSFDEILFPNFLQRGSENFLAS